MSLENGNSGMYMPVGPINGGATGFGGDFGGGFFWIVVLFLFAMMGGWNGNGFGGGNSGEMQRGFDQQAMMTGINGVNSAISSLAQGQCAGFADVTAAINQGFLNAEVANNSRQMADMQQNFGIQSALQQCCCDNRAAVADLKYTIANESANNRLAVQNGVQTILDKMCQDKIDAKNEEIANLRTQLNMASFNESQASQNNYLQNALTAQTQYFLSLYPPTAAAAAKTTTTAG